MLRLRFAVCDVVGLLHVAIDASEARDHQNVGDRLLSRVAATFLSQGRINKRKSDFQVFSVVYISCRFGKVGKVPYFVVFEPFFTLPIWPSEIRPASR